MDEKKTTNQEEEEEEKSDMTPDVGTRRSVATETDVGRSARKRISSRKKTVWKTSARSWESTSIALTHHGA